MISYAKKELAKYWLVSPELMAQYNDGSNTHKDINGNLWWYPNGKWHRDGDKPAFISPGGSLGWYQNGKLHRLCGPAIMRENDTFEWWINGKNITQEVNEWLNGEEWQGTPEQIVEFKLRFA